jgi:hypothetical protein
MTDYRINRLYYEHQREISISHDHSWVNPWDLYHFWQKKFFFDFDIPVRRIIVENG